MEYMLSSSSLLLKIMSDSVNAEGVDGDWEEKEEDMWTELFIEDILIEMALIIPATLRLFAIVRSSAAPACYWSYIASS